MIVTVEFTRPHDLVGQAISAFTWSSYVHCQFVIDHDYRLAAYPGRGVLVEKTPGPAGSVQLFIDAPPAVLTYALDQVGKPYDWTAIAGIVMHRDWREDDSWICSELVAAAFEHGGVPLLRADHLNRITPRDVYMSMRLADSLTDIAA